MVNLNNHAAFMHLDQRLYRFLGPDQSWRNQPQFLTSEGMNRKFTMPIQVREPLNSMPEHMVEHGRLGTSAKKMLTELSAAITG